jgi:DNA-directed RNA polymerase subunit RPC12/RpoP
MEKVCGKCSKEQGMPKEERIQLAMSRLPNTVYRCPICKDELVYLAHVKNNVSSVEAPVETIENTKKKAKLSTKTVQEQLELF